MEIKSKYNIGDKVYTLSQNKVICFNIKKIDITINEKETSIIYTSKETYEEYSHITGYEVTHNWLRSEDKIFLTKEELLQSL